MLATCYPIQVLVLAFQHCCAANKLVNALVWPFLANFFVCVRLYQRCGQKSDTARGNKWGYSALVATEKVSLKKISVS